MTKIRLFMNLCIVGLLAGSMAACSSMGAKETTGEYIDDSVISNTVRAKLLDDKDLNLTQIDVETFKGVVQLSGFVDTSTARSQ
jgi:osmotically-inducible protein OsmY